MNKLNIIQKRIAPTKKESIWYDGVIAEMGEYELVATGEVQVQFDDRGKSYSRDKAIREMKKLGWKDKDLRKLYISNTNWFEVRKTYGAGWGDINASDYDDGIELLKLYGTGAKYAKDSDGSVRLNGLWHNVWEMVQANSGQLNNKTKVETLAKYIWTNVDTAPLIKLDRMEMNSLVESFSILFTGKPSGFSLYDVKILRIILEN